MYYILYHFLSLVAQPLLPIYLKRRAAAGKEEPLRMGERFGRTAVPRPQGPMLWIHAASMGESQSVLPLILAWLEAYPALRILLTTVTVTSARHIIRHLPERAMHQYAPLDTPFAVKRFLTHWRPDMACMVDSELWPNMLTALNKRQLPALLLNGRISERSARRWRYARPLMKRLLGCFTHLYAKSDEDALRFAEFGATHAVSFGNLKFSAPPLSADAETLASFRHLAGERPRWLAASTHPGEEAIVMKIHAALKEEAVGLLTVIVPRHSKRGDEVRAAAEAAGLKVAQRSRGEDIREDTDLYLADTMGELGLFYRLCPLTFVGGSLVPHGGQNPLEPARLGCAIVYGPHMHNFTEACEALEARNAARVVPDAETLQAEVLRLLRDVRARHELAEAAGKVMQANADVQQRLMAALAPDLDRVIASYRDRHGKSA